MYCQPLSESVAGNLCFGTNAIFFTKAYFAKINTALAGITNVAEQGSVCSAA